jgi:hypothetical protein
MENTEIKAGDVVALKSDNNLKMVVEFTNNLVCTCVFVHPINMNVERKEVYLAALKKI